MSLITYSALFMQHPWDWCGDAVVEWSDVSYELLSDDAITVLVRNLAYAHQSCQFTLLIQQVLRYVCP